MEFSTLRIRHAGGVVGRPGTAALFGPDGREQAPPIIGQVEYEIDATHPLPLVRVEWDGLTASLEVVADLAEPIPGREQVRRVYVLCLGVSRRTKVCDADTGEPILVTGVRVRLVAGETPRAWVTPWP